MVLLADIAIILSAWYLITILLFILGLFRIKHPGSELQPRVSIIIAARNEEQHIGNILQDLVQQTYPSHLCQIIVANDGSSDQTTKIVLDFAARYPHVRLITIHDCPLNFSPKKYAIETAVHAADGDIILATDADCRVGQDWIASIIQFFTPDVGFVIGFSQFGRLGQPQNLIERLQAFDFLLLMGVAAGSCNLGLPLAASGQNLAYRREAFMSVGGYKKIASRISGDDVLLLQLVRRHTSYRIVFAYAAQSFASSSPQNTLQLLINQRKRWASNGSFQIFLNLPFFFYLLMVHLYNIILLFGIPFAIILSYSLKPFLLCLAVKAICEFLIAFFCAKRFDRQDLIKYFPIWFFLQIPYVSLMGILGTFGNFNWKGRKHSAAL